MKKILILGGNGFICSNLIKLLVKHHFHVVSYDLDYPTNGLEGVDYECGDFFNDTRVYGLIDEADIIIHAITMLNPGNSDQLFIEGYGCDFLQSVKIMDYSAKNGKKMIFFSSGGTIYGQQETKKIPEYALPKPINHYGSLKHCIEVVAETINYKYGNLIKIARISNPFGPGQNYKKGVGFIGACIDNLLKSEQLQIWGDGSIVRDYIFIDDLCEMLLFLTNYNGSETIFNLSSGKGYSQIDILNIIEENFGSINKSFGERRNIDLERVVLDNSKIMSLNNFELTDMTSAIKKTIQTLKGEMN